MNINPLAVLREHGGINRRKNGQGNIIAPQAVAHAVVQRGKISLHGGSINFKIRGFKCLWFFGVLGVPFLLLCLFFTQLPLSFSGFHSFFIFYYTKHKKYAIIFI